MNDKWFYYFTVTHYEKDENITDTGILVAENCLHAMKKLADYYGEENIENVSLKSMDCEEIGILTFKDSEGSMRTDFHTALSKIM